MNNISPNHNPRLILKFFIESVNMERFFICYTAGNKNNYILALKTYSIYYTVPACQIVANIFKYFILTNGVWGFAPNVFSRGSFLPWQTFSMRLLNEGMCFWNFTKVTDKISRILLYDIREIRFSKKKEFEKNWENFPAYKYFRHLWPHEWVFSLHLELFPGSIPKNPDYERCNFTVKFI